MQITLPPSLPLLGLPGCAQQSPLVLIYLDVLLHQVLAHYVILLPGTLGRKTRDTGSNTRAGRKPRCQWWRQGGLGKPWWPRVSRRRDWQLPLEQDRSTWEFPGGSGVRTLHSHCLRPGFNPWSGDKNPTSCRVRPHTHIEDHSIYFAGNHRVPSHWILPLSLECGPNRTVLRISRPAVPKTFRLFKRIQRSDFRAKFP